MLGDFEADGDVEEAAQRRRRFQVRLDETETRQTPRWIDVGAVDADKVGNPRLFERRERDLLRAGFAGAAARAPQGLLLA